MVTQQYIEKNDGKQVVMRVENLTSPLLVFTCDLIKGFGKTVSTWNYG